LSPNIRSSIGLLLILRQDLLFDKVGNLWSLTDFFSERKMRNWRDSN